MKIMSDLIDFNLFLGEDEICDHSARIIVDTAENICSDLVSTREKAVEIYHFVRDQVIFQYTPFTDTASDTLQKNQGHCFQKANLQVALLRAAGIPAGYKVQEVSPDLANPFVTEEAISFFGEPALHVYGCVLLDDHWIDADLTFDRQLLDFCVEEPWNMKETWSGLNNRTLPDHLLIGDRSDVYHSLVSDEPLPHLSDEILGMLNQRLLKMRAEMHCR